MTDLSKLALKGSSKIVCDYFEFAINSILFQRGIYPAEDFQTVHKYELPLLLVIDEDIKSYIDTFLSQIKRWVYGSKMQKLILVIIDKLTTEIVERWEFNLEIISSDSQDSAGKTKDVVKKEIQAIIRQITSASAYLPVLDGEFTFNILVYTDQSTSIIPREWADTNGDEKLVEGQKEQVQFSSFNTKLHKVGTSVSYRLDQ